MYQERTAVIRMILDRPREADDAEKRVHEARVREIAERIREITEGREEEIWLIRIPAERTTA